MSRSSSLPAKQVSRGCRVRGGQRLEQKSERGAHPLVKVPAVAPWQPSSPEALRGRWMSQHALYGPLRNSAWLVRNSRTGQQNNPKALGLVCDEIVRLLNNGEELYDVIEAICELLIHP